MTSFWTNLTNYLLFRQGCDLLIALTHMRVPNDLRLAREVPELHMVLGGHDHHYEKQKASLTLPRPPVPAFYSPLTFLPFHRLGTC